MRTISTRDVPRQPEPAASPHSRATQSRRAFTAWAAAASLAPLALYILVRPVVGTDAIALAITAAVSVVFACAAAVGSARSNRGSAARVPPATPRPGPSCSWLPLGPWDSR